MWGLSSHSLNRRKFVKTLLREIIKILEAFRYESDYYFFPGKYWMAFKLSGVWDSSRGVQCSIRQVRVVEMTGNGGIPTIFGSSQLWITLVKVKVCSEWMRERYVHYFQTEFGPNILYECLKRLTQSISSRHNCLNWTPTVPSYPGLTSLDSIYIHNALQCQNL